MGDSDIIIVGALDCGDGVSVVCGALKAGWCNSGIVVVGCALKSGSGADGSVVVGVL